MPFPRPVLIGLIALAVLIAATAATRAAGLVSEHTDTRVRSFTPAPTVVVSDRRSDLVVVASDRRDIQLTSRVRRSVWGGGHVHVTGDASGLRIDDGCDGLGGGIPVVHRGCTISLRLEVPRDVSVRVDSGTGSVRVVNVAGADISSGTGELRALGVRGRLRLDASTGGIHVESPATDIEATSATGDIEVTATNPAGPSSLRAVSDVGDVVVVVPDLTYAADVGSDVGDDKDLVKHDPASPRRLTARSAVGDVIVTAVR
jgi:hypothetical protein